MANAVLITLIAAQAKNYKTAASDRLAALGGLFGMLYAFSPKKTQLALAGFSLNLPVLLQGNAPEPGYAIPRPSGVAQQKRWFVSVLLTDLSPARRGLSGH
ncbi:hypothetical protein [Serratia fonticola]|uniref:Uncharacterized protein n=1 Tax=Serratia fonticola TaxID=47917 RepID=A0AAW3WSA2_SERFO|nr:hypothetical protein [Serratia fonticola]MBC3213889.1 hypothetical protein [Serratia fonticola]NYA13162.1 hypothetical protein [Serratia fonticola]NYA33489.1 hypothetical protein [Serratia fonticola]